MSKPLKEDVNLFTRPNNQPTDKEINEWTRKSRKEGICGIVDCFNKPTIKCKKCTNYYCSEHLKSHIDILPDGIWKESLIHYLGTTHSHREHQRPKRKQRRSLTRLTILIRRFGCCPIHTSYGNNLKQHVGH